MMVTKGKRAAQAAGSASARRDEKKPWFCLITTPAAHRPNAYCGQSGAAVI